MPKSPALLVLALLALAAPQRAQSNVVPGLDVHLSFMDDIAVRGREGTYPTGTNGFAIETTICNIGTVEVPWFAAMSPDHPKIAFLFARETNGRLEQISDRSYVKHGFFATTGSKCTTCNPPSGQAGTYLGLGCSDTYSIFNNGDNYWLGPPEEIDPWLGTWDPVCSFFDRGCPAVAPPADCDGVRSFTHTQSGALGPVGNRVTILDADLDVPNASFYFQGYYVVEGEAESLRQSNIATRSFTAVWNGSAWDVNQTGTLQNDSILTNWTGATVTSGANGQDDGLAYVAVVVTGPVDGLYHYEYAVQNRDNFQSIGGLRIPVCDSAQVLNLGFRDIDQDATNDWTAAASNGEIAFTTTDDPLYWNTFFNFWFDSDAAPVSGGAVTLDEFDQVAGQPSFQINATTPGALYNALIGPGCSLGATPPSLFSNDRATIGNSAFTLETAGNVAGQPNLLVYSAVPGALPLGACTLWLGGGFGTDIVLAASGVADGSGRVTYATPVPADVSLEGLDVSCQTAGLNPSGGPIFSTVELSNGLLVRIGDSIPDCP